MIRIVIENETVGGIQHDLKKLLEGIAAEENTVQPVKTEAPKRVQPSVSEPEAVEETPVKDEPQVTMSAPTMEQTRAKLNELRGSKGPKEVRAILTRHNVGSFTELNPDEYAAVIAEVDAAL